MQRHDLSSRVLYKHKRYHVASKLMRLCINLIFAHQIRKSWIQSCDRNSYPIHGILPKLPASVAHLDARLTGRRLEFDPRRVGNILSRRFEHEMFFYGLSLPSAHSRREVICFWRKNVHNTV